MIGRRTVLNGTALGSALAALTSQPALEARGEEAVQANSERVDVNIDTSAITSSINALRTEVRRQDSFWEIEPVREPMKAFLRQTGKYPDYIEVGTDIWHQVLRLARAVSAAADGHAGPGGAIHHSAEQYAG